MSEAVKILISAEDQASVKVSQAAENFVKAEKKVDAVVKSLQSPLERYENQLKELEELHKSGVLSAEKYAVAQQAIADKIDSSSNAYKEVGGQAKSASEFVGTLANLAGGSELAGLASQMAEVTDRVGEFSEVAKGGKASAFAFKAGLVALVGTLAIQFGKAIGDIVFETEKFNKALEHTKERAADLTDTIAASRDRIFAEAKEDIELIRDPEEKQAAYKELLDQLKRDVDGVSDRVKSSERAVEEWAGAWKITGERKASAEMAETELANDLAQLKALKEKKNEIDRLVGTRAAENAEIARKNQLAEKSDAFIESLREEVELLKASKEEQIKLNAARNTTPEAREEAERLLRERDAIREKIETERELAREREQAANEQKRAAEQQAAARQRQIEQEKAAQQRQIEQAKQAAEKEVARVEDLVKREQQRLNIRQIEIEQGKQAAKMQSLINQGVDKQQAKELAAKEAALDKLSAAKQGSDSESDPSNNQPGTLQAKESRLLSRGPGGNPEQRMLNMTEQGNKLLAGIREEIQKGNKKQPARHKPDPARIKVIS